MSQLHRKGHRSKNKVVRRCIERKQRQAAKLFIAGKEAVKKHKPKKKEFSNAKVLTAQAYPCSPKQLALGEVLPKIPLEE